jgi:hypothetical protein
MNSGPGRRHPDRESGPGELELRPLRRAQAELLPWPQPRTINQRDKRPNVRRKGRLAACRKTSP